MAAGELPTRFVPGFGRYLQNPFHPEPSAPFCNLASYNTNHNSLYSLKLIATMRLGANCILP